MLGPLEVRGEGRALPLGRTKPSAILAFLLLHRNESVSAERLALALWGEDAPAGATKTVQVHVSRLRKVLGDSGLIATTPAGYRLQVGAGELDLERFERLVERGRRALDEQRAEQAADLLREALSLWRGPPLADLSFEPFAQVEIARLEEQRLDALALRIDAELAAGRHAAVVAELRELIAAEPTRERVAAQLMLALYRCGRQADALDVYQRVRRHLSDELGLQPGPELTGLHAAILAHEVSLEARPGAVAPPDPASRSSGLPRHADRTLGRQPDVEAVAALLRRDDARLLTLIGTGGVGKTRLAVAVAEALEHEFAHGARFVSLAATERPEDAPASIAQALDVALGPGEDAEPALRRFLGPKQMLVVLDNLEHLLSGVAFVGGLAGSCPGLRIIATSREPLRLRDERCYPVRPLNRRDAVTLFHERAERTGVAPELDDTHVGEICGRLDDLPLAIELAAARLVILSPEALLRRLDDVFMALGAGPRDAPDRQRTLRATVKWSLDLLDEPERDAFAAFGVFAGGATLDAVEDVAGATLECLESLAEKSLLIRSGDRIGMLETVRQYAEEQLRRREDADRIRARHADHFARFAERAETRLSSPDRRHWLTRLDAEVNNIRAALRWTLDSGEGTLALALAAALPEYWLARGSPREGMAWLELADTAVGEQAPPAIRAKALLARASLHGPAKDVEGADAAARRAPAKQAAFDAATLYRTLGDDGGTAAALIAAGHHRAPLRRGRKRRRARTRGTRARALAE